MTATDDRYVILRHQTPPGYQRPLHWDLMLQSDQGLLTWALEVEPQYGRWIRAERLADHRRAYLDYEGPVSGGRGWVTRWDAGAYRIERQSPCQWLARLDGPRLPATVTLRRTEPEGSQWSIWFSKDGREGGSAFVFPAN